MKEKKPGYTAVLQSRMKEYRKRKNSFWFGRSGKDFRGTAFWAEPEKMVRNKKERNGIPAEGLMGSYQPWGQLTTLEFDL